MATKYRSKIKKGGSRIMRSGGRMAEKSAMVQSDGFIQKRRRHTFISLPQNRYRALREETQIPTGTEMPLTLIRQKYLKPEIIRGHIRIEVRNNPMETDRKYTDKQKRNVAGKQEVCCLTCGEQIIRGEWYIKSSAGNYIHIDCASPSIRNVIERYHIND